MKEVKINTEYITLGQLLKFESITSSGGETKFFLANTDILVNSEPENRRGKKLRPNDVIEIDELGTFIIKW